MKYDRYKNIDKWFCMLQTKFKYKIFKFFRKFLLHGIIKYFKLQVHKEGNEHW